MRFFSGLRKPSFFVFAVLFIYTVFPVLSVESALPTGSEESQSGEAVYITSVSVTGLKRTRLSTAEKPLQKFIGLRSDEINYDDVAAAVIATGILEPVSIEIIGSVLYVTVHDKWSIFPVPVFFAGSGGIRAGLAFYDANAFGLNDKFFITGMYQTNGWLASMGYIHSSSGGHSPGFNGAATFNREERHDSNQKNEDLRVFAMDTISAGAGINVPLIRDSDLLSASFQLSFAQKSLREKEDALNGPDKDLRLYGSGIELSFRKNSWDGYFLSQETASVRYSYRTDFDGLYLQSARFRGAWEKSIIPGFRFISRSGVVYEPEVPVLFESSPGAAQVDILPKDFSAAKYAGVSAGLEKYLFKFGYGILSLLATYQLVYSEGSKLGECLDHGVTGMLVFYLNRLAIPALGAGIAYNVKENYLQGSFSLGMSL